MLPSGFLWATLASLIAKTSCSNDFVTSKFPSEFKQNETSKFYWDNLNGYIAGIRVDSTGQDSGSNSDWILEPNCSDGGDSDSSSCTAYANNGSASFGGSLSDGTQVALGSGYKLVLLWTDSKSYDDIDDDTSEEKSPTFSIVPGTSRDEGSDGGGSGMSKGEKAGIVIAVILVIMILMMLLWKFTKERRHRRNKKRKAERDEEKGDHDRRWTSTVARGLGMKDNSKQESWVAATGFPEKPRPTASRSARDMSKRAGRLYIDDKAELPSDPAPPPHRIDTHGFAAAGGNKTEPQATSTPMAPVELPTEPPRREDEASWRSRTASTTFVYDPKPPYALRTPASLYAEPVPVSPLSPTSAGAGANLGPIDDSVSPLTPISRKPVGGGMRAMLGGMR